MSSHMDGMSEANYATVFMASRRLCSSPKRPNARFQPPLEAGTMQERTLYAVGCKPLFGSGYDSQKRFIDFPVNTPCLEQL